MYIYFHITYCFTKKKIYYLLLKENITQLSLSINFIQQHSPLSMRIFIKNWIVHDRGEHEKLYSIH